MTKTQAISAMILELVEAGMSPREAMSAICGKEAVDAMISDLYDALRAKAVEQGLA